MACRLRDRGATPVRVAFVRLRAAIFAAGSLVWSTAWAGPQLPAAAAEALRQGAQAAEHGEWTRALDQFNKALAAAPGAPEVVFDLALVNDKMGGGELAAIAWYRAYLALAPTAANRSDVSARVKELEAAVHTSSEGLIQKALAVNRNLPEGNRVNGLSAIANSEAALGQSAAALALIGEANPGDLLNSYELSYSGQNKDDAVIRARDSVYDNLAKSLAVAGDFSKAEEAIHRISSGNQYYDPHSSALYDIVAALAFKPDFEHASSYAELLHGRLRMVAFENIAEEQFKKGDKAGAKRSIDKAVSAFSKLNRNERNSIAGYDIAKLALSVSRIEGLDAARSVFATIDWTWRKKDAWLSLNMAAEDYIDALVESGRIDEAKALLAKMKGDRGPTSPQSRADDVIKQAEASKVGPIATRLDQVRSVGDIDELASDLAASEPTPQSRDLALKIAQAYRRLGERPKAEHALDALAASILRQPLSLNGLIMQIRIACEYAEMGQADKARKLESVRSIPPAWLHSKNLFDQQNIVAYVADLTEMARAQRDAGDETGARDTSERAFAIAGRLETQQLSNVLGGLCRAAPALGLAQRCETLLAGLPADKSYANEYEQLLEGFANADVNPEGEIEEIKKAAAGANGMNYAALRSIIGHLIAAGDWAGASQLAEGSADLTFDIVQERIAAGQLREASALEPLLAADPKDGDRYIFSLAHHLAEGGDIRAAIAATAQIRDPYWRVLSMYGVANLESDWYGDQATTAAKAASKEIAVYFSRPDSNCYQYQISAPVTVWSQLPASSMPASTKQCLGQNLRGMELGFNPIWWWRDPPQKPSAETSALSAERRYWDDRNWAAAENTAVRAFDDRDASRRGIQNLYADGAIELADARFTPSGAHPETVLPGNLATSLLEDVAPAVASALAHRLANSAALVQGDYSRADALAGAVDSLLTVGDFNEAERVSLQIDYLPKYADELRTLSEVAVTHNFPEAKALVAQEISADKLSDRMYELNATAGKAAQLGMHPEAERADADYRAATRQYTYFPRDSAYLSGLLRHGDYAMALEVLKQELPGLKAAPPSARYSNLDVFAQDLAWAGDEESLKKLLSANSDPTYVAKGWRAAASGYAKAGKPDFAREALKRALGALKIERPDFEGWAAETIAEAQDDVDPAAAAATARAIADPEWRAHAIAKLADARFSARDPKGAIALLEGARGAPLFDPLLARGARDLYAQGLSQQGQAMIERIGDPGVRDATWHFAILVETRQDKSFDPFAHVDRIHDPAERTYLLIDLSALLAAEKRMDDVKRSLDLATAAASKIDDPLTRADAAVWISVNAAPLQADFAAASRQRALAAIDALEEPAAKSAMQNLLAGLEMGIDAAATRRAYATRVTDETQNFARSLGWQKDLGDLDAYVKSLAVEDPNSVVGSLVTAAEDRIKAINDLAKTSAGWTGAASH